MILDTEGREKEARMKNIAIAIDGPAGAGKSTVAKNIAERLGYLYIDTGAMYRGVTFLVIEKNLSFDKKKEIIKLSETIEFEFSKDGTEIYLNRRNCTKEIRDPRVNEKVSIVAKIPEVRNNLVKAQQKLAADRDVVMDGRDIGTHVLPDADLKIFLTASVDERAMRRFKELNEKQSKDQVTLNEVRKNIIERDRLDSTRDAAPLVKAKDAFEINTTNLTSENVADKIINLLNNLNCGNQNQ